MVNSGGLVEIDVAGKHLREGCVYQITYQAFKNPGQYFFEPGDAQAKLTKMLFLGTVKKLQQCLKVYTLCDL